VIDNLELTTRVLHRTYRLLVAAYATKQDTDESELHSVGGDLALLVLDALYAYARGEFRNFALALQSMLESHARFFVIALAFVHQDRRLKQELERLESELARLRDGGENVPYVITCLAKFNQALSRLIELERGELQS